MIMMMNDVYGDPTADICRIVYYAQCDLIYGRCTKERATFYGALWTPAPFLEIMQHYVAITYENFFSFFNVLWIL